MSDEGREREGNEMNKQEKQEDELRGPEEGREEGKEMSDEGRGKEEKDVMNKQKKTTTTR